MSRENIVNVAASVRQKLLNRSKEQFRPFNEMLQYYGMERFLYRLSVSKYQAKFVLKGALLFTVWHQSSIRSTTDIDLLGKISNQPEDIVAVFQEICRQPVPDDGMRFDDSSVSAAQISLDANYHGIRVQLYGYLGTARVSIQVDIGFSDVITPGSERTEFPTILDMPVPSLDCYNKETVIAEKFQAMVKLDIFNSRMKDFYDIWLLAGRFDFDAAILAEAISNTFTRRDTEITTEITAFTQAYFGNNEKQVQWKAFLKRSVITNTPPELEQIVQAIQTFLLPVLKNISQPDNFMRKWDHKQSAWL